MDITPIVSHYEKCLAENDDPLLQVDWTNKEAAEIRYKICKSFYLKLEDIFDYENDHTLLDFGCGLGELSTYLGPFVDYVGCDISSKMVDAAKQRFPKREFFTYERGKIPKNYDVVIMNGVLTERRSLSNMDMDFHLLELLLEVLNHTNKGLIFNVMNPNKIKWQDQRPELFFVGMDHMTTLLDNLNVKHYDFYVHPKLNDYFVKVYKC